MSREEIAEGLRQLGLQRGNIVMLHASLASLGLVEGGPDTVVEAFLEVLGKEGTLLAPVFEPGLGVISEAIANHPRAVKSIHPLASVAAIGRDAEELCRDHWKADTAHAEGTPFMRVAERGGFVCLLGVDQDRNTTLHTAEALLRLDYLKTETRTFATPEGPITKSWNFFPGPHRNFIGLDPLLRKSGRMKVARIGNAVVRLIRSQDLIDLALAAGRTDPGFVLCANSDCPDCKAQHAALRKARFDREDFALAVSASVAGQFVEEIAVRCQEAGVASVELDSVRQRPLLMATPEAIAETIEGLRTKGLQVVSLRTPTISDRTLPLIRVAGECGVARIVVPLGTNASGYALAAREHRVAISFFNDNLDSDACSEVLLDLRKAGFNVGFTFNGANFARCGELPFLSSYKKKLRRFVDQLDLVDGTYAGGSRRLGHGNAEVKEMISILRCAGFAGTMTLGGNSNQAASLNELASDFYSLLNHM